LTRERRGTGVGAASLHAAYFRAAMVSRGLMKDVKGARIAFMELDCKVGCAAPAKITRAPFNVKVPVGRSPGDRSEHAAAAWESRAVGRYLIRAQVVLVWEDSHLEIRIRQRTTVTQTI